MKKIQILSVLAAAGLVAGCSSMGNKETSTTAMTLDQLPQAAQTTVRNEVGDTQIYSIKQESKDGQTAYKVEVDRRGFYPMRPSLIVAQDGSILKESRDLANRHSTVNEAAGAENSTGSQQNGDIGTQSGTSNANSPSAPAGSPQAPSEANPAGTSPSQAQPSATGNGQ